MKALLAGLLICALCLLGNQGDSLEKLRAEIRDKDRIIELLRARLSDCDDTEIAE